MNSPGAGTARGGPAGRSGRGRHPLTMHRILRAGRTASIVVLASLRALSLYGTLAPAAPRCHLPRAVGCPGGVFGTAASPAGTGDAWFDVTMYDGGFWIVDSVSGANVSGTWTIFEGDTIHLNATSLSPNTALGGTAYHGLGIEVNQTGQQLLASAAPVGRWVSASFVAPTTACYPQHIWRTIPCGPGHSSQQEHNLNIVPAIALPLRTLPAVAARTDLGLPATRFPRLRLPDAAISNGLFLSLILWPSAISLELTAVAVVTVGVRHLLRFGGHPLRNPAAVGITLAAVHFALRQPWHVGFSLGDSALLAALGLVPWSRAWHTWRLWAVYFAVHFAATLALADLLGGSSVLPLVVQTTVLGGAPVFYGFFMVTEPRTAPSARWAMVAFGVLVGATSAVLPVAFAQAPDLVALGVLTPYLALFTGNLFAAALPSARAARRTVPVTSPARSAARLPGRPAAMDR